jgi:hypothetical protein
VPPIPTAPNLDAMMTTQVAHMHVDDQPILEGECKFDILFLDCAPVNSSNGRTKSFAKFLAPLMEDIAMGGDGGHYKLDPDNGFGKAAAMISERVKAELYTVDNGTCFIASSRIAEHRDCLQVLEAAARLVIKAF